MLPRVDLTQLNLPRGQTTTLPNLTERRAAFGHSRLGKSPPGVSETKLAEYGAQNH